MGNIRLHSMVKKNYFEKFCWIDFHNYVLSTTLSLIVIKISAHLIHNITKDVFETYKRTHVQKHIQDMIYVKFHFLASKPTLLSIRNKAQELGQRLELSATDILQVNELYSCSG